MNKEKNIDKSQTKWAPRDYLAITPNNCVVIAWHQSEEGAERTAIAKGFPDSLVVPAYLVNSGMIKVRVLKNKK